MTKVISKENKIFRSDEYLADKYLFNVFEKKINHENAKIMSDEENYVITNENEDSAPWIWTKDNFDKSKLKEIEELISIYLVKNSMTFTCKKELYDALVEDDFNLLLKNNFFELGFMKCDELILPRKNDGWIDRAKPSEKQIIVNYIYEFENFMDDSITHYSLKSEKEIWEECYERADMEMNSDNFYVLRNKDNKIVCMAHYTIGNDKTAKVGLVYTSDEERGKGYAGKLVYEITKMILNKGCIPILYVDQNYPNSNKAYANVGYFNCGTLINFICRNDI